MNTQRIMQLADALRGYGKFRHRDIADDFLNSARILEAVAKSPVALAAVNSRIEESA